jgi:hypothetical protein
VRVPIRNAKVGGSTPLSGTIFQHQQDGRPLTAGVLPLPNARSRTIVRVETPPLALQLNGNTA